MSQQPRKIVIIGGGIAGLCAAVYAQSCGYQAEVIEMHDTPGGLATSWHRHGYTFENCLHWLVGSNPQSQFFSFWKEVFDIDKLTFINPDVFLTIQDKNGDRLRIHTNTDYLESELIHRAPEDAAQIRRFTATVRKFSRFQFPDLASDSTGKWLALLRDLPYFPLLQRYSGITGMQYGERFINPLLKSFFTDGYAAQMSCLALFFSLAWMNNRDAGYPIGGSQAVIRLIVERLTSLGGKIRLQSKVEKILVQDGAAIGVHLTSGESVFADWVISASDTHATLFDLLNGRFNTTQTVAPFHQFETFPSYLLVSLGIAQDLSQQPAFLVQLLDAPLQVDPGTRLRNLAFRFFHFDPTFAPDGKTAVNAFLPTRNFQHWLRLRQQDLSAYDAEKQRIAEAVIAVLEKPIPNLRAVIEVTDIATPATVIRYTANWHGSMEGWLLTPATGYRPLPNALPGLDRFFMVGQWVSPGGGLPSGLLTARSALQAICKLDHVPFTPGKQPQLSVASPAEEIQQKKFA
ncbi:MAG TPA: NAD(P)/FAD-dependent oxidoreductase [Acidobacteriaceae bacterium]|nr:NAD(P)/FAD-dependent oxidoreductase [Acidobacteriaceae bacterium]